jgi:hypothetical protein
MGGGGGSSRHEFGVTTLTGSREVCCSEGSLAIAARKVKHSGKWTAGKMQQRKDRAFGLHFHPVGGLRFGEKIEVIFGRSA